MVRSTSVSPQPRTGGCTSQWSIMLKRWTSGRPRELDDRGHERGLRDGTASLDVLSGSTFTITSLGRMGGLGATPIINHPEVAILGVHNAVETPVVRNGQIVVRRMLRLSSSFDHRVVDGFDGASMVQALKGYLEHPATIFM